MSLLPELDKKLITKGWARVETEQPVKLYYQWYSFIYGKWIQCRSSSPDTVKYQSLYRRPVSILAWINVGWELFLNYVSLTF